MNQVKIGKFIADMRRRQGLTQKQLADQLTMTDKTISKWETGHRLPDALVLPKLSSILKVSINELLAGEEFSSAASSFEEYIRKSENNIIDLVDELNEIGEKSRSRIIGVIVGFLLLSATFLYLFAFSLRMGQIIDILDLPALFYPLGIKAIILSISGWFHDYLNAWRTVLPRMKLSKKELEQAAQAMKYAGALTLSLGGFVALLSLFSLLNYMDTPEMVWSALAQIVVELLYTTIEITIYVILTFRLKRMTLL